MSLAPYYYRPVTPPEETAAGQLHRSSHSRHASGSSYYTNQSHNTSPESVNTNLTTPGHSPVLRQHGPTLLPKIRTQDSGLEPSLAGGPARTQGHRRVLSATNNPPAFASHTNARPPMQRSQTEPVECTSLISPVSNASVYGAHTRASSTVPSPITLTASINRKFAHAHARSSSASNVDESVLRRYGYPTYRQTPSYLSQAHETPSPTVFAPTYLPSQMMNIFEPPMINIQDNFDIDMFPSHISVSSRHSSMTPPPSMPIATGPTSSLLTYLTQSTQPVNLVRNLTLPTGRATTSHFWWDVRNVRSWSNFSLSTISSIPDLLTLLNFPHEPTAFPPSLPTNTTATPASETDLANLITKIYFPKANTATRLSLGTASLSLYPCPASSNSINNPTFLANYATDNSLTSSGLQRGRIVGLALSFDRWNTGMRREGPARKVQYLKGLAHLQKCMREHSCRYGFIMSEIELVCVRAGCDESDQPYFGFLEISEAIPVKQSGDGSMTVTLALYLLLMLGKSTPLPGQPAGFMDVGGPGAMTRQRVWDGRDVGTEERGKDGKDKWIPEPQVGEKRDAKTVRGWVMPSDPWHKREGGGGRRK